MSDNFAWPLNPRLASPLSFQYMLKTFYEERTSCWKEEPYMNQPIEKDNDTAPPQNIWEIEVKPPQVFYETEVKQEIPHTASINVSLAKDRHVIKITEPFAGQKMDALLFRG